MDDQKTFQEDLVENIAVSSEALSNQAIGSAGRINEAKIYDTQSRLLMEVNKQDYDFMEVDRRFALDKWKVEQEIEIKREASKIEMQLTEAKYNNEKATLWAKVAIAGVGLIADIGIGILYLKANMKYGGMMGRDSKKWFDDLRRIKL